MLSLAKAVGALSCCFFLCLGLSSVASSADTLNTGQLSGKIFTVDGKDRFVPGKEVRGEIVKIDGGTMSSEKPLALRCECMLTLGRKQSNQG